MAVVCLEQITAGALTANADGRQSHRDHLRVASGDCKEGSRNPFLLEHNHHIEIAIKQQNVRNRSNKKFEERDF